MSHAALTRRALAAAIAASAAMGAAPSAARAGGGLSLRRGINIYHMMQGAARGPGNAVVWPPFASPAHDMPDAQIIALRRAGFDFVRLTLAADVFLRANGASGADTDALYALLQANIRRFTNQGLSVVVVIMPGNVVDGFRNSDIASNVQGVFDALCEVVGRCAGVVQAAAPGRVAMEPLNEPAFYGLAELRWPAMQQRLHQAVRGAASTLPVVLTGGESGGLNGLLKLDPSSYRGSNVLFSLHYYEPHIFTHQHVGEDFRYLSGVAWPPRPQDLPGALSRANAAITADKTLSSAQRVDASAKANGLLSTYYRSGQGLRTVADDFARAAAWARGHGVDPRRILLGEFGVTRTIGAYAGASEADVVAWLSAVRTAAERNGFAWALWAYSGPVTMTLANEYPARTFDPQVLQALGLSDVQP